MPAKKPTALSTLLEEVSGTTEIVSVMERALVAAELAKPPFIPKGFHPSSLSTDSCARQLVYERISLCKEPPHDARLLQIFADGTSRGIRIQNMLVAAKILREDQTEVPIHGADTPEKRKRYKPDMLKVIDAAAKRTAPFEFRGHLDGLVPDKHVIEIKGINTIAFDRLREPLQKHMVQTSIYADAFGLNKIIFLYDNKNTQEIKEFVTKPDQTLLKEVKAIVSTAKRGLDRGVIPSRHDACHSLTSTKASKCPFMAVCFGQRAEKFSELDKRSGIVARDYR